MKSLIALLLTLLICTSASADDADCVRQQVVKIRVTRPGAGIEDGAGFIFRVTATDVYVLTAAHVVPNAEPVANVSIGFSSALPGHSAVDQIIPVKGDDVVILRIARTPAIEVDNLCLWRDTPLELHEAVHYVGHPIAPIKDNWATGEGAVVKRASPKVRLNVRPGQSKIRGGFSGGAVYDSDWRLVGMLIGAGSDDEIGDAYEVTALAGTLESQAESPGPFTLLTRYPPSNLHASVTFGWQAALDRYVNARIPRIGLAFDFNVLDTDFELSGWLDLRERSPVVYQYPGEAPIFGPEQKEVAIGGAAQYMYRKAIGPVQLFGDAGIAVQRLSDGNAHRVQAGVVAELGGTLFVWRMRRLSSTALGLTARARVFGYVDALSVNDYHFSLAGTPGQQMRDLPESDVILSAGPELLF